MDELTPLRNTRDASRIPADDAFAKGRAGLLSRAASDVMDADVAPSPRDGGWASVTAQRTIRPRWATAALDMALTASESVRRVRKERDLKKRTIIVGALVAAAGMVAVGGLAAVGGAFTNPEAGPLPEGVDVVTQQVYDDAFAIFEACMKDGGASIFGKRDEAGVHQFSYLAQFQPVYDKCYVDFAPIDFRWQISRSYYTPEFDKYRECLSDMGIEPGKDADAILAQVEESGLDVRKCFEEGTTNG